MRPSEAIGLCEASRRNAVLALLDACGLPKDGLADHWDTTWVAADPASSTDVLGSVALEVHGKAALLRSLATRPDQRSRGLGQALFAFAMVRAEEQKVDSVALLTTTAGPFFARRGFQAVSREALPESLRASAEFQGACPASAVAMIRRTR